MFRLDRFARNSESIARIVLTTAMLMVCCSASVMAQDAKLLGDKFIPLDGVSIIEAYPAAVSSSQSTMLLPWEVAEAWCEENLGIKPSQVESLRMIIATPAMGPQVEPLAALVIRLNTPVKIADLNPQAIQVEQPTEVDGLTAYPVNAPAAVVIHQVDPQTMVLASNNYLELVVDAANGKQPGALSKLSTQMPKAAHANFVIAIEPIRPIINGGLQMFAGQLPPPLQSFVEIPNLLDAIYIGADLEDAKTGMRIMLVAKDDESAGRLEEIVQQGFETAKQMGLAQLETAFTEQNSLTDATRAYVDRISDKIIGLARPKRQGVNLVFETGPSSGTLLMPLMIAGMAPMFAMGARSARGEMMGAIEDNNLKMLLLGMHNYHSAHGELPTDIKDKNGKALLSWRVKLLPFIEQQGLYQRFDLNEPWDSDHNKALIKLMPEIFSNPEFDDKSLTAFQLPVGEGLAVDGERASKFRDFLDGLSNTVLILQSNEESAVVWSKPGDLKIDLEQPDALLEFTDGVGTLGMCDGAVNKISKPVDAAELRRLLTRAARD